MSESIAEEQSQKKPKFLGGARRERLHPDWPIKIYKYDCWPQQVIPQALWDTAKAMRSLWNDLVTLFRNCSDADLKDEEGNPLLSKDERNAVWAPLEHSALREIAKGYSPILDNSCRQFVVSSFLVTFRRWRKNPKQNGPPKYRHDLSKIKIPLDFDGGKPTSWLTNGKTVSARNTLDLKPKPGEGPSLEYLLNGHFCVGIDRVKMDLHIALHRDLPEGRIKQVAFCGRKVWKRWEWSLQVRFEHPPTQVREETGRVCGWDSAGWRAFENEITMGVIADNAGYFYRIGVPVIIANSNRRREREHVISMGQEYAKPITWYDLFELDSQIGKAVENCKTRVREIFAVEKESWPESARQIMSGIVKMRDRGLRLLRKYLEDTNSEAKVVIDQWIEEMNRLESLVRPFEIDAARSKDDAFRQIANWLYKNFDQVAWEGDLSLKEMAEGGTKRKKERKIKYAETGEWEQRTQDERILEASQKCRQIVGQSDLRQYVKEKLANRLVDCEAAYSSQFCTVEGCGAHIVPTSKLLRMCDNGHEQDQDVVASIHFLNQIQGPARISAMPIEIPVHLRRYLRLMSVSEVAVRDRKSE